ncbi:MAG: bifunctional diaminohydroxyphosphoribosylaminopyrimidine deaminase/5-amino-6-(5-phosphoribosylamino)uracil reductase RibD [Planctomycetaceae bacterium]
MSDIVADSAVGRVLADDREVMLRALQLARRGLGFVEPNPMVGAVIVDGQRRVIAEGFHQRFGEAHAEVHAIRAAGARTSGQRLFVTLEPCSHHGKTPPCADAVIAAGFREVVIGCPDPAEHVAGAGIRRLRDAGILVVTGLCQAEAEQLIQPFRKLMMRRRPWVHAKWAMTLDGKIASRTGHSQWISCEQSRAVVHELRGRMDAIITAAGTMRHDDPLLTARPAGARTALRIVLDDDASSVRLNSRLITSLQHAPVLLCVAEPAADSEHVRSLQKAGAEILVCTGCDRVERAQSLLDALGQRQMTHCLLEGGAGLLGVFFDGGLVDEVHVFVAPKLVGGRQALGPVGGQGKERIPELPSLSGMRIRQLNSDVLIEGDVV